MKFLAPKNLFSPGRLNKRTAMSTSNTNQKNNDKIRARENSAEEEKPNKKQKLDDPAASSEKPEPELPKVLPFSDEITNVRFLIAFRNYSCFSEAKLRSTISRIKSASL